MYLLAKARLPRAAVLFSVDAYSAATAVLLTTFLSAPGKFLLIQLEQCSSGAKWEQTCFIFLPLVPSSASCTLRATSSMVCILGLPERRMSTVSYIAPPDEFSIGTIPRRDGFSLTYLQTSEIVGRGIIFLSLPEYFVATRCEYVPVGPRKAISVLAIFSLQ